MRRTLGIKEKAKKIRHIKAKLVKKKLKSMVSAMKCKHARVKQLAHKRKEQVKKLVHAVAKLIKAKKASSKAAKVAVAAANAASKASISAVKA